MFFSQANHYATSLQSPLIDSSDLILLSTMNLVNAKKCMINAIEHNYMYYQYQNAMNLICSYCPQLRHAKLMSATKNDNPMANDSRRYFETQIAKLLMHGITPEMLSSVHKFNQFLKKYVPANSDIQLPEVIKTQDDVIVTIEAMRLISDVVKEIETYHNHFRQQSAIYTRKDRGDNKYASSHGTSLNMAPGIIRSIAPMPCDEQISLQQNKISDLFTIKPNMKNGYSTSMPHVPFVNSITGTGYTLIVMLEKYMQEHTNDNALAVDVNNIVYCWLATGLYHGCHSFKEMIDAFEDPIVVPIFAKYNSNITVFNINDDVISRAFKDASDYACILTEKKELNNAIKQLRSKVI